MGDEKTIPRCPDTCAVHGMMEDLVEDTRRDMRELRDDIKGLRDIMVQFMQHAAEEHTKIREEILLVAKTAHETRGEVSRSTPPGMPHPVTRADDFQEKVVLTLSRKDFWKIIGVSLVIMMLLVGFALIAGRDGLDIWGKAMDAGTKTVTAP